MGEIKFLPQPGSRALARSREQGSRDMMEALRKGAQTWVAKLLLVLVMGVFALIGMSSMDTSATIQGLFSKDLATVGGKAISSETFRAELNRSLQLMSRQSGSTLTLEDARKLGIDRQVLDRLITQAAIDAQGSRLGLAVGDQAVSTAVQSEAAFKDSSGKFDVNRFRNVLNQNGLTERGFIESERVSLTRGTVTGVAGESITLPRTMLEALNRYRDETRDARYFSFTVNEADVPAPTDAELKTQYDAAPAAYTAPEYRAIAVMKLEAADISSKVSLTEQEISDGYNTFKQDYFQPETRDVIQLSFATVDAAKAARTRIAGGEDILKVAESLGQKTKDITFTAMRRDGFLDEKIGAAAFALKEGELSDAVAGVLNTVLLKAVKVVAEKQPTLEEARPQLTERLKLQKAQDEIQSIYDSVEEARGNDTKLEAIGENAGLSVLVIPAVSQSGTDKAGKALSLPVQDQLLPAVFKSDVGLLDDAISIENGYVWYDVREVIPAALRPLEDVKAQVTADWKAAKLRTLAGDKAKAALEKAGSAAKLESLATELGGTVKTVSGVKRSDVSEEFDGVAALALFSVPEKGMTWALEGDGKTARIIEASKVTVPSMAASKTAKDVADLGRQGLGGDLLDGFVKSARDGTTVEQNEELWRQISGTTQPTQ
jgi:peptidyl-prolyl cis-trans isomerase D